MDTQTEAGTCHQSVAIGHDLALSMDLSIMALAWQGLEDMVHESCERCYWYCGYQSYIYLTFRFQLVICNPSLPWPNRGLGGGKHASIAEPLVDMEFAALSCTKTASERIVMLYIFHDIS